MQPGKAAPQNNFMATGSGSRPLLPNTNNQRGSQLYTGTHDGATLYSSISFNVDEFKLYKILKNVCQ